MACHRIKYALYDIIKPNMMCKGGGLQSGLVISQQMYRRLSAGLTELWLSLTLYPVSVCAINLQRTEPYETPKCLKLNK